MLPVLCGSSWARLGWVPPAERRQICEKSFPPILLRDLISPQAKPHSPGGTGSSAKSTFRPARWARMASWYCCKGRKGGVDGGQQSAGSTQGETGRGQRQQPQEEKAPLRQQELQRETDEDSKTREQTDSSQPRREAAGPPWQYARASGPCAHPHCPEPGCLPHGILVQPLLQGV